MLTDERTILCEEGCMENQLKSLLEHQSRFSDRLQHEAAWLVVLEYSARERVAELKKKIRE